MHLGIWLDACQRLIAADPKSAVATPLQAPRGILRMFERFTPPRHNGAGAVHVSHMVSFPSV
jgi:hypothetical protein